MTSSDICTIVHFNADNFSALALCQTLETLYLGWTNHTHHMPSLEWVSFWAVIAECLAQVCPNIRDVSLLFYLTLNEDVTDGLVIPFGDGLEALDPAFERDAFAGLKRVLFGLYFSHNSRGDNSEVPKPAITLEQTERVIHAKLPKLHKRGIIRVEYKFDTSPVLASVSTPHRLRESSVHIII